MESSESANTSWSLLSSTVAICITGFLVLLIWRKFDSKRLRLPPGPRGWPVLGHLPMLGRLPHRSLMKMSQKYGPLMSIRLGSVPTVVITSPDMAKIFFRTQDHMFANRANTMNGDVFMYKFQDLGSAPYNDHWRRMRRLVDSEIFSQKRLKNLKDVRNEEILATVERLVGAGREGKLVEINKNIAQLSFDHISRICFSKRYFSTEVTIPSPGGKTDNLHSILDQWAVITGSFMVGEYIPSLRKFDIGGHEARLLKLRMEMEKFMNPIIVEHRHKQEDEAKDFLDVLLCLQRDTAGGGFSDVHIKALLQNMLIGGTETAVNTTIWAVAELMRHPEAVQKIVDELDLVVGKDRLVNESDLVELKYLKATVKETFRMYPVIPLHVPHAAIEDTQVAGYDIPKKTRVLMNSYAIGRDLRLWTNPNKFNPERFLDSPIDVRGQHFELLPFGAGRRQCPGMDMGLFLVETALAQIFHTCVLSLPPGMEVDVEESRGFMLTKKHLVNVLVAPRLRPEVYSQYGIRVDH